MAAQYGNPNGLVATTQGSAQRLANGNMVVGWGSQPHVTEFANDGNVLFDANFGASSYRAYRFEWHAAPTEPPTAVGKPTANGQMRVAVSWNGATEVRRWQLLAGLAADRLSVVSTVDKTGFGTTIDRARAAFVQLGALDARGRTIGTSPVAPVR